MKKVEIFITSWKIFVGCDDRESDLCCDTSVSRPTSIHKERDLICIWDACSMPVILYPQAATPYKPHQLTFHFETRSLQQGVLYPNLWFRQGH